jgi:hypothetical protein
MGDIQLVGDKALFYCSFPNSSQICTILSGFRNYIQGIYHPVLKTVLFPQPFPSLRDSRKGRAVEK